MESSTPNRTAASRTGRFHRGRALAVTVLAAGTAVAALAPVTAAADASERSAPSPAIGWTGCGTQLECARVSVPLDWAQRGGRTITLSVIRHLASHPGQRIGSLFVNPGGPGDSGVAAVAERGGALDAITGGRFDIVGWDPRGSGGSTPVSCFASSAEREAFWQGMPVPTTRQDEQRYLAKSVALAQRCGARNGDLLAHISTTDTARDLDYLRGLVGDSPSHLLRRVDGYLPRTDLRQHVPAPSAGHGPRRPGGPGQLHRRPRHRPGEHSHLHGPGLP